MAVLTIFMTGFVPISMETCPFRLARAAAMSPRNFARVYPRETGESPARAVEKIRIEAAIALLESSTDPIKVIAHRIGFGDDERMRRAFLKAYGISPQDYRSRFGRRSR